MNKKPSLADLRAKFKQKSEGKKKFTNTDVYPHWEIPVDSSATVRILPDLNENNENYYFVDKLEHKLSISGKDRKIACLKMYGEKCPICDLSAKYYKAEGDDSVQGKYYYFSRKSLMKALIIKDPIERSGDDESAEGQVKTLQFTFQLMKLINKALSNEEEETALQELPWDMDAGYNFIIQKTKQGKYEDYTTSSFSNRVSGIAPKYEEVVKAGRVDLATLLPPNPGLEKVQAFLEAHLSGGELETESHGTADNDAEAEEAPPRRRSAPVVEAEAEEAPPRRRAPVVEAEAEEAPPRRRSAPVVEAEEAEAEDETEAEFMRRIRDRNKKTATA